MKAIKTKRDELASVDKKIEQLEKFVARFHAQPNKAASVRAKRRVLEKAI